MRPADLHALRLASEQASDEYLMAQAWLIKAVDGAHHGLNDWPTQADYDAIRMLGLRLTKALRLYLDAVGVPHAPRRSSVDRMRLIERLAKSESRWQPTPEAWLRQQDKKI